MRLIPSLAFAFAFFLIFGAGPLPAQNGLFFPLTTEPNLVLKSRPETATRQRLVRINLDQLRPPAEASAQEAGSQSAALNLFDDVFFTARLNPPQRTPSGGRSGWGSLRGFPTAK